MMLNRRTVLASGLGVASISAGLATTAGMRERQGPSRTAQLGAPIPVEARLPDGERAAVLDPWRNRLVIATRGWGREPVQLDAVDAAGRGPVTSVSTGLDPRTWARGVILATEDDLWLAFGLALHRLDPATLGIRDSFSIPMADPGNGYDARLADVAIDPNGNLLAAVTGRQDLLSLDPARGRWTPTSLPGSPTLTAAARVAADEHGIVISTGRMERTPEVTRPGLTVVDGSWSVFTGATRQGRTTVLASTRGTATGPDAHAPARVRGGFRLADDRHPAAAPACLVGAGIIHADKGPSGVDLLLTSPGGDPLSQTRFDVKRVDPSTRPGHGWGAATTAPLVDPKLQCLVGHDKDVFLLTSYGTGGAYSPVYRVPVVD